MTYQDKNEQKKNSYFMPDIRSFHMVTQQSNFPSIISFSYLI